MKRNHRYTCMWAGLGVALALPLGRARAQDAPALTLEQAIELALRNSPLVAQALGGVRTSESAERSALGAFLPNLSLTTAGSLASTERFNPQTNTTVTGSSDSYNAGISASLDLFTGGRRGAERRRARAQTTTSEATLVEQRFAVILAAKRAFFEVLRGAEQIRVAEARQRRAQEGLDAARRRLDVGSATRSDLLRAQLELTNARQALLEASSQKRSAEFALGRLVGAEAGVDARAQAPFAPRPLAADREQLAALALEQSPGVRSADAAARAASASLRAARAQYLPTLQLSSGYDLFNQEPALSDARASWSLRLGLSFPLFNRFQREDAVTRADVQTDVARAQLADARREARAEFERIFAALELAEQRVALAEEAVRVAEEDLRVQEERYRLGASTILDRLTSQANVVAAENDRIAARYDYEIARAELEALVGREL